MQRTWQIFGIQPVSRFTRQTIYRSTDEEQLTFMFFPENEDWREIDFETERPSTDMKRTAALCLLACISAGVFFLATYDGPSGLTSPEETIKAAVLKCIPVAILAFVVYSTETYTSQHSHLQANILVGLLLSMVGNILFVWRDEGLNLGFLCFAVVHLFYINAFSSNHLKLEVALICWSIALIPYVYFFNALNTFELKLNVGFYAILVASMWWRTIAYFLQDKTVAGVMAFLGGACFSYSDYILLLDHVHARKVPYAAIATMVMYYLAQLFFAISVVLHPTSHYMHQDYL